MRQARRLLVCGVAGADAPDDGQARASRDAADLGAEGEIVEMSDDVLEDDAGEVVEVGAVEGNNTL